MTVYPREVLMFGARNFIWRQQTAFNLKSILNRDILHFPVCHLQQVNFRKAFLLFKQKTNKTQGQTVHVESCCSLQLPSGQEVTHSHGRKKTRQMKRHTVSLKVKLKKMSLINKV